MNYETLLNDPRWHKRRKVILERDQHRCINCKSERGLQVHHRVYVKLNKTGDFIKPWEYKQKYLITLCNQCHEKGHQQYKVKTIKL